MTTPGDAALAKLKEEVRLYKRRRPPKVVVLYFAAPDLAGFLRQNIVAAALLDGFSGCFAAALFKGAPDWRAFVVDCNPWVTMAIETEPGPGMTIPVDWFDVSLQAVARCPDPVWYDRRLHMADLVLLPGMLSLDPSRFAELIAAPPPLRLPQEQQEVLRAGLVQAGIPEDRWFACLEGDTETIIPLVRSVERQGGIAVRTGEVGGGAALPSCIDLRSTPIPLQAAAARFARYAIGNGGLTAFASIFGTPAGGLDPTCLGSVIWNPDDVIASNPSQVGPMADLLHDRTPAASGWRNETPEVPARPRQPLPLPLRAEATPRVRILA